MYPLGDSRPTLSSDFSLTSFPSRLEITERPPRRLSFSVWPGLPQLSRSTINKILAIIVFFVFFFLEFVYYVSYSFYVLLRKLSSEEINYSFTRTDNWQFFFRDKISVETIISVNIKRGFAFSKSNIILNNFKTKKNRWYERLSY